MHSLQLTIVFLLLSLSKSIARRAWILAALFCLSKTASAQAPANDNFSSRINLSGSSVTTSGSNTNATSETGEPFTWSGRNSVWWSWTAPSSGTVTIRTSGSTFDTTLAAFTGSSVSSLTQIAANDDADSTLQSRIDFTATAGNSYQIQVSSYSGQSGFISLSISQSGSATAPTIISQPVSATINSGSTTTLLVTATGTMPLTYQWFQGSSGTTTIPVGTNSASFTTPSLTTTTSYWVRVSNSAGNVNSNAATITVNPPPVAPTITSQPASTSINSGSTVVLSVTASGTSPLSYQWYQGGLETTTTPVGTNSPSYTTPALTTNTSYWVRVGNIAGSVDSSLATVSVSVPPGITSHPVSNTVDYAGAATLSVTASGTTPLTYQWYQGSSGTTTTPVGSNSETLTTPSLTSTTSYWVRVSNSAGNASSNTATITVNPPVVAPIVTTHPASTSINSGNTATLTVSASGTSPLTYQWYQGASGTTTTPVGTNSATFTTPSLTSTTSYWLRVTNSAGNASSNTATITVNPPVVAPIVTTHPASTSINSGNTVTLTVTASGTSPLTYQWYQGASGTTTTPVGTNSATFTTPSLTSTTSYWIRVTNSAGNASSNTATITVNPPVVAPSITTHPASTSITSGSAAALSVTASGTAPLTYQWYQGSSGTTTTPVGTNSATFTTPSLTSTTSYWVRVSNAAGNVSSNTATVTVTAVAPSITTHPASTSITSGSTATLSVAANGTAPLTYQWYQGSSGTITTPVGTNSATFTTPSLTSTTSYWVRVSNAAGNVSSNTATVTVTVVAPSITTQPVSTIINSVTTAFLSVVAGGTSPFNYQWYQGASGITTTPVGANSATFTTPTLNATTSYWVRVSNSAGAVNSTTATVTFSPALTVDTVSLSISNSPYGAGVVYASIPQPDGSHIFGGAFSTPGSNLAKLKPDGTLDSTYLPNIGGFGSTSVHATALQGNGMLVIGGKFTSVGGVARENLARLHPNGMLDESFRADVAGSIVHAVVPQVDGKLLVAGDFNSIGGNARPHAARLLSDGSLDSSFNLNANGVVRSVAVQDDGRILLGGDFSSLGGAARTRLARVSSGGVIDSTFNPAVNGTVHCILAMPDGRVTIAGNFTTVAGVTRNYLARLSSSGTVETSFNPAPNGVVHTMALQADGKLLIGGVFTTVGGTARSSIARLNADGSLDATSVPSVINAVHSLALQSDGKVVVGGSFTLIGSPNRSCLARLNNETAATQTLAAVGTTQIDWMRGGSAPELSQVSLQTWSGTAWVPRTTFRTTGGWRASGFSLPAGGWLRASGRLAAGSHLGSGSLVEQVIAYGSAPQPDLAVERPRGVELVKAVSTISFGSVEWLSASTQQTITLRNTGTANLSGLGFTFSGPHAEDFLVEAPAVTSLAPGQTTTCKVAFQPRGAGSRLAQLRIASNDADESPFLVNLAGTGVHGFDYVTANTSSSSYKGVFASVTQPDGKVLLGGNFTGFGPNQQNALVRLNADGSVDTSFNAAVGSVYCITLQADGRILIGGTFLEVGGRRALRLARLYSDGTRDPSFNSSVDLVSGSSDTPVRCILMQPDGKILIGGTFTRVGTIAQPSAARLNADGSLDTTFSPVLLRGDLAAGSIGNVDSMALLADGKVLIAGGYIGAQASGIQRGGLLRLDSQGALDTSFAWQGSSSYGPKTITVQPDGRIIYGGQLSGMGRVMANGSADPSFAADVVGDVTTFGLQADGRIVIGGDFTSVNGMRRSRLARLFPNGSLDPDFAPEATSIVGSIALQPDGKIWVDGRRLQTDRPATSSLSRSSSGQLVWLRGAGAPELHQVVLEHWNGTGWTALPTTRIDGGWQSSGTAPPAGSAIRARGRMSGGSGNGSSAPVEQSQFPSGGARITVLGPDDSALVDGAGVVDFGTHPCFQPALTRKVMVRNDGDSSLEGLRFVLDSGDAGDFSVSGGAASLVPGQSTEIVIGFQPRAADSAVCGLRIYSSDPEASPFDLLLKGKGLQAERSFAPLVDGIVRATATLPNGGILIAGDFVKVNGVTRSHLARLHPDGSLDETFDAGFVGISSWNGEGVQWVLVDRQGRIWLGRKWQGSTTTIMRLWPDGSPDKSFAPSSLSSSTVNCAVLQADDRLVVGGNFTSLRGVARNRIARLNSDGTLDAAFNPNADGEVRALCGHFDGSLWVAGSFLNIGAGARSGLARLATDGTVDLSFAPSPGFASSNASVNLLLAQPDGKVLVGGNMTSFAGSPCGSMVRLHASGTLDGTFNRELDVQPVCAALQADGKVVIGGSFTSVGGVPRNRVARLFSNGTLDLAIDPNVGSSSASVLSASIQPSGKILVAGIFSSAGGADQGYLALLANDTAAEQRLSMAANGQIDWQRGSGAPEVSAVRLESWNGSQWSSHPVARVAGGWRATANGSSAGAWARASGWVSSGDRGGSGAWTEQIAGDLSSPVPELVVEWSGAELRAGLDGIAFGICLQHRSVSETLTFRNAGAEPLQALSCGFFGANPEDFAILDPVPEILQPGEQVSVRVRFSPAANGRRSAFLAISSNAVASPHEISLVGTGIDQDSGFTPVVNGSVTQTVPLADGRVLIAGSFTEVGGLPIAALARLHPDGSPDPTFNPKVSGTVESVHLLVDGRILIAGSIYSVGGLTRSHIARLGVNGEVDPDFAPVFQFTVNCIQAQPDGKLLVGGRFTTVNGVARNRLARLNTDGTLDASFDPNVNGTVESLAVQADGKILVCGSFTTVGGVTRNRIARIGPDGSIDTGFNPNANSTVSFTLPLPDGKILVAGSFSTLGGNARSQLARLAADGTLDASFNPTLNSGVSSAVLQADGKLLVGGTFTSVGGIARSYIARLNPDGSLDVGFSPAFSTSVRGVSLQPDGGVLVCGSVSIYDSTSNNYVEKAILARLTNSEARQDLRLTSEGRVLWERTGSTTELQEVTLGVHSEGQWHDQSATRTSEGWSVSVGNLGEISGLRASGRANGGGQARSSWPVRQVAHLDGENQPMLVVRDEISSPLSDSHDSVNFGRVTWPGLGSKTLTISNEGTGNLSGLSLALAGSHPQDFILEELPATTLPPGGTMSVQIHFRPNSSGDRYGELKVSSNDLERTPYTVRLRGMGVICDADFRADVRNTANSVGSVVTTAREAGGSILVGGSFTSIRGVARTNFARLLPDGSVDPLFNPALGSGLRCLLVLPDGGILVGGSLGVSGNNLRNLVRLHPNGDVDTSFDPKVNSTVETLALQSDGKLLLGGSFSQVGGVARNRIARINPDGTLDSSFDPNANSTVSTLAIEANGNILMGGAFTTVGSFTRNRLARVTADGTIDPAFDPNINGAVQALWVGQDGWIHAGGSFTTVGTETRNRLARFWPDGRLDASFNPDVNGSVVSIAGSANGSFYLAGSFTRVGNAMRNCLARLEADGSLDPRIGLELSGNIQSLALLPDGRLLIGGSFDRIGGLARASLAALPAEATTGMALRLNASSQVEWLPAANSPALSQVRLESWDGDRWANHPSRWVDGAWRSDALEGTEIRWIRASATLPCGGNNASGGRLLENLAVGAGETPVLEIVDANGTRLTAESSLVDFGDQPWPGGPRSSTLTVRNVGNADLLDLTLRLQDQADSEFSIGMPSTTRLAAGQSVTIPLTFSPAGGGERRAVLNVSGSHPGCALQQIQLRGKVVLGDGGFPDLASGAVRATVILPDGRLVACGRLSFDSSLSFQSHQVTRFGAGGVPEISGYGRSSSATSHVKLLALRRDGRLVYSWLGESAYTEELSVAGSITTRLWTPNGNVECVTFQTDQATLVGGSFTSLLANTRNRIARVHADGTLDSGFNPDANSTVEAIVVQADNKILIGGSFTTIGGVTRNRLARLNTNGSLDATFVADLSGSVTHIVAQPDGKILVAGSFTTVGGAARSQLARLNADGTLDAAFQPRVSSTIHSMLLQMDGSILIGGDFTEVNGRSRNRLARLDASGALDERFDPNVDNSVYSLALEEDGSLVVGGNFDQLGGSPSKLMARIPAETAPVRSLGVIGTDRIEWQRGAGLASLTYVVFETWNGTAWVRQGTPVFENGVWRASGLNLPASSWVRAWGHTRCGYRGASSGLVEQVVAYGSTSQPALVVEDREGQPLADGDSVIDFGRQYQLSAPITRTVTIRNAGGTQMRDLAVKKVGFGATRFTIGELETVWLEPGEATTVSITFTPNNLSLSRAVLQVTSSDLRAQPYEVVLSGMGASNTADLATLAVTGAALDRDFDASALRYSTKVPAETEFVTITPTVKVAGSTVRVDGVTVVSGSASAPVWLGPGVTTIMVEVTAQDGINRKSYQLDVARGGAPLITSEAIATGTSGEPFSYQITATNDPSTYRAEGLPAGLVLDRSNGLISGVPTTPGEYQVTLGVSNEEGSSNLNIKLTIDSPLPVITSAVTAQGQVGRAFEYRITATKAPTRYGADGLPQGLEVHPTTGLITGIPLEDGTFRVTLLAENSAGQGSLEWLLTVLPQAPVVETGPRVEAVVGEAFEWQVRATQNPTRYTANGLPPGLSINETTGVIAGVPTEYGNFEVLLGARNAGGQGQGIQAVRVSLPPPVIEDGVLSNGTQWQSYLHRIKASADVVHYEASNLPPGLRLNPQSGWIHGVPREVGAFTVRVSLRNATTTTEENLRLMVEERPAGGRVVVGGTYERPEMRPPSWLVDVAAVSAGPNHFVAARLDGRVVTWGWNSVGEAIVPASLTGVVDVLANDEVTLALKADGTVVAWQPREYEQASWYRPALLSVPAGLSNVEAISLGTEHALALRRDGTVVSWGRLSTVPANLSGVMAVAAGNGFSAAIKSDGSLVTWEEAPGTVPENLGPLQAIAAGNDHWVALQVDGTIRSWRPNGYSGFSDYGQTQINGWRDAVAIAAGGAFSMALLKDGTVREWGHNGWGFASLPYQMDGVSAIRAGAELNRMAIVGIAPSKQAPVVTPASLPAARVGQPYDYRIVASNTPLSFEALGLPRGLEVDAASGRITGTPAEEGVFSLTFKASNAVGEGQANGRLEVGSPSRGRQVALWGASNSSIYGSDWLNNLTALAAGSSHAMAITESGSVRAWGANNYGQCNLYGLDGVIAIAAGWGHSLALLSDGTIREAGLIDGMSSTSGSASFTSVARSLTRVRAISAMGQHSMALQADGVVVSWRGSSTSTRSFGQPVSAIAAGGNFSLALLADGTVDAWGDNSEGQTRVPQGLSDVMAIGAGLGHALALKRDGTVVAWGTNLYGEINVPAGLDRVVEIAAGDKMSMARREDGSVWVWGDNSNGANITPAWLASASRIAAGGFAMALVGPSDLPVFTSSPSVKGIVGQSFEHRVTALGSVTRFEAFELPQGWRMDPTSGVLTGMGTAPGEQSMIVAATNSFGTTRMELRLTFVESVGNEPGSLASWRMQHYGRSDDSGNAADLAVPDGDGIPNLVKYALLMTPGQNSTTRLPQAEMTGPPESRRLTLTFQRDPSRSDVAIVVEAQSGLDDAWSEIARSSNGADFTGAAAVSESAGANGSKTVTVQDSQANASRRFMRVRVER